MINIRTVHDYYFVRDATTIIKSNVFILGLMNVKRSLQEII